MRMIQFFKGQSNMGCKGLAGSLLAAGLVLATACGQPASGTDPAATQKESSSVEEGAVSEAADEASGKELPEGEGADEKEPDSANAENDGSGQEDGAVTDQWCKDRIDALRKTDPVLPAESELLAEMGKCVTFARVLDEKGCLFSELDAGRQGSLRAQVLKDVLSEENAFSGAIPFQEGGETYEADRLIPVSETVTFMKELFGAPDFTQEDHYEKIEDDFILWSYGDGEPWEIIEHMQFFEDDAYYLLTGPAFYEDNGGSVKYMGYADLLFQKNPDSRYGVTLLYGRYRDDRIEVASVDTSSELPGQDGKTYSGQNLIDGDYATAWAEGVSGTGEGESVTLKLSGRQPVYGVQICNGYVADAELFAKNGKAAKVRVDFGNGTVKEQEISGYGFEGAERETLAEMNLNRVELDAPVETDAITITITGAEAGSDYDDTCISEIRVY